MKILCFDRKVCFLPFPGQLGDPGDPLVFAAAGWVAQSGRPGTKIPRKSDLCRTAPVHAK